MTEPHPALFARRSSATAIALVALALGASAAPAAAQQSPDDPRPSQSPTATTGPNGPAGPEGATTASAKVSLVLTRSQTRQLQRKLGVRADGAFGARTRAALRRWERRAGLPADGRADAAVLARRGIRLTRAQADPAAEERNAPAEVAETGALQGAVDAALEQEGTPYSSSGEQPGGFDCSGLTSWAFKRIGVTLPRTSSEQYKEGTAVAKGDIRAGDLVFFDSAGPGASDVGIATSATKVVSATTHGVMEHATFDAYWGGHYVGARRVSKG